MNEWCASSDEQNTNSSKMPRRQEGVLRKIGRQGFVYFSSWSQKKERSTWHWNGNRQFKPQCLQLFFLPTTQIC